MAGHALVEALQRNRTRLECVHARGGPARNSLRPLADVRSGIDDDAPVVELEVDQEIRIPLDGPDHRAYGSAVRKVLVKRSEVGPDIRFAVT